MSYNYKYKAKEKHERLVKAWSNVPQDVFARLSITTDKLHDIDKTLLGHIVLPGMDDYPKARRGQGLTPFDEASPQVVFMCEDELDIWYALRAVREHGWAFVTRSGGHSTAGFSSDCECVIDLSGVNDISLDGENRVSAGPGVTFGKLNRFMRVHKRHIPTGNCDDVRCGGYVQGGGYGYTSRQFGMQCDCVAEATVLLADGRTVLANSETNPDLYWAIRGGTGNNFGIVINIVYETVPLEKVWGFVITWGAEDAPLALKTAQDAYAPDTGLEIGYTGNITTIPDGKGNHEPVYMFSGICIHGRETGMKAIQPMLDIGTPTWLLDDTDYYYEINDGVEGKLPGIPPPIDDTFEIKSSAYLEKAMTLEQWTEMFQYYVDNIAATNPYNLIVLEAYGGAINERAPDDTAFVHRNARMDVYIDAFWRKSPGLGDYNSAQNWIDGYNTLLAPHMNGHWYQNYPQRDMPNYRWQYFGDNYNGLLFVKHKFDPDNVFHYEQSITPYPQTGNIDRSTVPSKWSDPDITYSNMTERF